MRRKEELCEKKKLNKEEMMVAGRRAKRIGEEGENLRASATVTNFSIT